MKTSHSVTSYEVTRNRIDGIIVDHSGELFTLVYEVNVADQHKSYYVSVHVVLPNEKAPEAYAHDLKGYGLDQQ